MEEDSKDADREAMRTSSKLLRREDAAEMMITNTGNWENRERTPETLDLGLELWKTLDLWGFIKPTDLSVEMVD